MIYSPSLKLGENDPAQLLVKINSIISAYNIEHDRDNASLKAVNTFKNNHAYL